MSSKKIFEGSKISPIGHKFYDESIRYFNIKWIWKISEYLRFPP